MFYAPSRLAAIRSFGIVSSLQIARGLRIASYEIIEPIGSGGMGEVYRAADRRLGRDVAIKTLPDADALNDDALARFEREARLLASINHPNIASIYGLEEVNGQRFLVMELIPGPTLSDRLAGGALPFRDAIRIALQIAAGLSAAHEAGVVHRDLKPSNIKITADGLVKILDFGIAKSLADTNDADAQRATERQLTRNGTVVGTPGYMSPEQMQGSMVDKRTDVWAFGCLLYEMLTGRRAFAGGSFYEVAAAVANSEPDWNALPPDVSPAMRQLLRRCLKKDPNDRLRDVADIRLELSDSIETVVANAVAPGRSNRIVLAIAGLGVAALIAALFLMRDRRQSFEMLSSAAPPTVLSQFTFDAGAEEFPAFSPDGETLVYCSSSGPVRKLFLRAIKASDARPLTKGEQDDVQPVWSSDGGQILFVRAREPGKRLEPGDVFGAYENNAADVWTIDVESGKETLLIRNATYPAISPDGRIAVDATWGGNARRIWICDERGRNPQQLTSDSSEAVTHIAPRWSPDGKRIVYQHIERTRFDISSVDVATKQTTPITNDLLQDINPVWSASGDAILFSSYRSGGMNVWRVPVGGDGRAAGPPRQLTTGAGQDVQIAVAPRGGRIAFSILHQNADLWTLALDDGGKALDPRPLISTTREDSRGSWSADGIQIAFNSDRTGDMNIWVSASNGSSPRQITRGPGGDYQPSWSPDGKQIAFFSSRSGNADIWLVDVATGRLTQLTKGRGVEINPVFARSGDRIAYVSDEGGRLEVWLMKKDGSDVRRLTDVGVSGHFLAWTADGRVLFRCPCGGENTLMAVAPDGEPRKIMQLPTGAGAHISFSPDGSELIDVVGHKTLWRYKLGDGSAMTLFAFDDARIDYPMWSPDGRFLLFDRFRPEGADLWLMETGAAAPAK